MWKISSKRGEINFLRKFAAPPLGEKTRINGLTLKIHLGIIKSWMKGDQMAEKLKKYKKKMKYQPFPKNLPTTTERPKQPKQRKRVR